MINFSSNSKMDFKAIAEAIDNLDTLQEKLQYFNDNYQILIFTNVSKYLNAKIIYIDYTVYCTCKECENRFSITDYEVYRDFVNNQTDNIVKYFNDTIDYKTKLEYYNKLDASRLTTKLVLKYVPNTKEELKDYYNFKEVTIDVTPQNEIEFNILLDLKKSLILNSENNEKLQRTPIHKGTEFYNASRFIFENRVEEITNYLELIVDENDRKHLIKKYLDSINIDKIDFEKIKIKRKFTHEFANYEILQTANKIIQKFSYDKVINTTDFSEIETYLLALETIKFKKYLNSLLFPQHQNSSQNPLDLILHNENQKDADGFPVDENGKQISLMDKDRNVIIPLQSNFLISIKENSIIKFNPKDKTMVYQAVDTLTKYLTINFYEYIEGYFTIDLTDEVKKERNLRTKEPVKILKIQMYFDWITKWLNYIGNVFNVEFKLLFYAKYKEKIKMDVLSLATGLKTINAPQSHIDFTNRWIEETDKNIELEIKAKGDQSKIVATQKADFSTNKIPQQTETTVESISLLKKEITLNKEAKPAKKLSEKWHALLYLLELKASNSKPPINHEGSFIKSAIEEIGKKRTGTTGQSFYRQTLIINDLINNSSLLVGTFGNNWKETIITLSNNDQIIIDYIENNY
jgi:hypothetical protein